VGEHREIWQRFSTPLAFESPPFRNGAMYLKSKTNVLGDDDWPYALSTVGMVRAIYAEK